MVRVTVLTGSGRPGMTGVVGLLWSGEVIVGETGGMVSTRRFWDVGAEVLPAASVAVTVVFTPPWEPSEEVKMTLGLA